MIIDYISEFMYKWNMLINEHVWFGVFTIILVLAISLAIALLGDIIVDQLVKIGKIGFFISIPIYVIGIIYDIKDMKYLPIPFIIIGISAFLSSSERK